MVTHYVPRNLDNTIRVTSKSRKLLLASSTFFFYLPEKSFPLSDLQRFDLLDTILGK